MTTQTLESPAAGSARRPPAVLRALRWFRHWRKARPFPAGLLITLAGIELWLAPYSSIGVMIHEGIAGFSAVFIGSLLVMFGLTVWFASAYRMFAGIAAILLGLIALPTVNLGGFFLGTLLALIGGALATSWVPRPGWEAPTWGERRRMRAAQKAAAQPEPVQPESVEPEPVQPEAVHTEAAQTEPGYPSPLQFEASRPDEMPTADLPEVGNTGATERPED